MEVEDDSEENTATTSYRSEEAISSSSTDEGICSTISGKSPGSTPVCPGLPRPFTLGIWNSFLRHLDMDFFLKFIYIYIYIYI